MAVLKVHTERKYRPVTLANVEELPEWKGLDPEHQEAVRVVAQVLPFRTNEYVVRELIDWSKVPDDPIFILTFPQKGMLEPEDFNRIRDLMRAGAPKEQIRQAAHEIRLKLNPHPAGQLTHNVPTLNGRRLEGLQHKYPETVLIFPGPGQVCHAFCTYCFRWAQFVGEPDLRMATNESEDLQAYLRVHPEVTDILFTGGDPMVMKTAVFERFIRPLLSDEFAHVQDIRIGTKALAYWPFRFFDDDLLKLFEEIVEAGRHLAIMAHFTHPNELQTDAVREAIRLLRSVGAEIRTQSPVVAHINDDADAWARKWKEEVRLGLVPYYMFVERDTGPKQYFEVPLVRAWEIFRNAYKRVPGLARTVRGPSMSAFPGKVRIAGVAEINGEKVFVLEFLQGRNPDWVGRPFFAKYDEKAVWLDQLKPAFGEKFFYEDELAEMVQKGLSG